MKRKIIPFILITLFTLTSTVHAFSDTENHWAKEDIEEFSKANIIKGYENNIFKPDEFLTRAEMATIINRMTGVTKESSKYIPDITRQDWYYKEIRKAVQSGIMHGDENGYTNPNSFITREEAIIMISRAFSINDSVISKVNFEDENEISKWAKDAVNTFVMFDYVKGYEDGTIRPKNNITRAELITVISRIFSEIATGGIYSDSLSGNLIVIGKNVVLKDLTINGNLIIAEGTKETIALKNVEVRGDLILREKIDTKEIFCMGRKVLMYLENEDNFNIYNNKDYGINFSISSDVKVIEKWNNKDINYNSENLIVIDIDKSDEYYLKSIETIGKSEIRKVDNIYKEVENGRIDNVQYILYKDTDAKHKYNLLVLKRDNVVYTMLFNNVSINNLVDNVLGTINFYETELIKDRKNIIYKNNKLNLKFSYKEGYVGVDDSYNTNNIYSGDAPMKLFIQVNTITDMQDYEFSEIVYLLKTLARKDGELQKTESLKLLNKDAVKFVIVSEDKLMNSLYIIDENILYNFIFIAAEDVMNEVGDQFFDEIIENIEI